MEKALIEVTSIITQDLFHRYKNKSSTFEQYDRIYPFTTESLSSYMKDLNNKDVLCIGSSGDHAIESFYHGANSVDTFDINILTNYYQELKLAAVKLLEYDEFITLFNSKRKWINSKKELIDLLAKLKDYIKDNTYTLFEYIINRFVYNNGLLANNLFYARADDEDLRKRCSYMNDNNYYEVQRILKDKDISYSNLSLHDLSTSMNKNYDAIFLSNITTYIPTVEATLSYLEELLKHLNDEGRLYFAYLYCDETDKLHPLFSSLGDIQHKVIPSANGDEYKDIVYYIKK